MTIPDMIKKVICFIIGHKFVATSIFGWTYQCKRCGHVKGE